MPGKFVDVGAYRVHVLHTGATTLPDVPPALDRGRPFLCLHGAGRNAGDFAAQLSGLGQAHSVVAVDLPGHGRSPQIDGLASVEAYADVATALGERLALRPAVLVGWSLGAHVALVAAARRPDRCAGLVLVAAGPRFAPAPEAVEAVHDVVRGRRPQIFDTSMFSPATGMEVMRSVWTEQVKTDPRVLHGDLLAGIAFDPAPYLGGIHVPVLVIAGADDRLAPPASAEALARAIPGARFETVAAAGHAVLREQPEALNALLAGFAEALPA